MYRKLSGLVVSISIFVGSTALFADEVTLPEPPAPVQPEQTAPTPSESHRPPTPENVTAPNPLKPIESEQQPAINPEVQEIMHKSGSYSPAAPVVAPQPEATNKAEVTSKDQPTGTEEPVNKEETTNSKESTLQQDIASMVKTLEQRVDSIEQKVTDLSHQITSKHEESVMPAVNTDKDESSPITDSQENNHTTESPSEADGEDFHDEEDFEI